MPTNAVNAQAKAAQKAAQLAAQRQQQLAAQQQQGQLPMQPAGLVSPYDGTTPGGINPAIGGYPLEAGAGVMPGSLAGLDAGRPQVNATNQSALAPNGDINQSVTNENKYENKYYNIITSPYGAGYGYPNPMYPQHGGWGTPGIGSGQQAFIDPTTGALVVQRESGFIGWVKRLFRGY